MSDAEAGQRTPVATADHIAAHDPDRIWLSVPRNDDDLSEGYDDLTYAQVVNGINHAAAWLDATLGPSQGTFETFACLEPAQDLRTVLLSFAAAKTGRRILLLYAEAPLAAKVHLLAATGCDALLFAETTRPLAEETLAASTSTRGIAIPGLGTWLSAEHAAPWPAAKPWDAARDDSWIILHSSGTTGLPKPVVYTQRMLTQSDVLMARLRAAGQAPQVAGVRMHTPVTLVHLSAIATFVMGPVFSRFIGVLGPTARRGGAAVTADVVRYGRPATLLAPAFLLREMCRDEAVLSLLKARINMVRPAGTRLDQATGDALQQSGIEIHCAYGSTEMGPIATFPSDNPKEWSWFGFFPGQGLEPEPVSTGPYLELVIHRRADAWWQQIFLALPDVGDTYRSKDLFERHPTKPHLYRCVGRTDDTIRVPVDSALEELQVGELEAALERAPSVHTALIAGSGRPRPFLLVYPVDGARGSAVLKRVQEDVEDICTSWPPHARIDRGLILLTDPARPLARSAKGSLLRASVLAEYASEIDALYERDHIQSRRDAR